MRGPGLRRNLDVRRVWRCPACGKELPTSGAVTSLRCRCETPGKFMELVEPRRKVRPEMKPPDIYFECAPPDEAETVQTSESALQAVAAAVTDAPTESSAVSGDVPVAAADVVTTAEVDLTEVEVPEERGLDEAPDMVVLTEESAGTPESSGETSGESGGPGGNRKRKPRRGRRRRGRGGNRTSSGSSGSGGQGPT